MAANFKSVRAGLLTPEMLNTDLADWIVALYEQALCLPWKAFKPWTFEHICKICPFSSGLWWSRSDLANKQHVKWSEDTSIYGLPEGFMDNYARIAADPLNPDPLNLQLHSQPGDFVSLWDVCSQDEWHNSIYYQEHCIKFGIEHAISVLILPSDNASVTHIVSLYREREQPDFSLPQRKNLASLLPHLMRAFLINLVSNFNSSFNETPYSDICAAVDRFGEIVIAEDAFIPLMKSIGLFKNGRMKLSQLPSISGPLQLNVRGIHLKLNFHQGIVLISASPECLLQNLSIRQREICDLISKGLTNKEIAKILGLQINTVNNHVHNILRLLNVRSREAATAYLIKQRKNSSHDFKN